MLSKKAWGIVYTVNTVYRLFSFIPKVFFVVKAMTQVPLQATQVSSTSNLGNHVFMELFCAQGHCNAEKKNLNATAKK